MKIEIVENGTPAPPDATDHEPDGTPAEASATKTPGKPAGARMKRLKSCVRKAVRLLLLCIVAALCVKGGLLWNELRTEKRAAEEDLYRRRVRAQLELGRFRLKPALFGPTGWSLSFSGEKARRWKRIAAAFENRRWREAVPLLLGKNPPPKPVGKTDPSFPSSQDILNARDALVAEMNGMGRTLVGIQSLVEGLCPSPEIRVSPSVAESVGDIAVTGRGVDVFRSHVERGDWLGLVNGVLHKSYELYPPFETIREPLQKGIASLEAFLVLRGSPATSAIRILYFPDDSDSPPRVLAAAKRLPDDSGWMVPWDLRTREAFVLSPSMADAFLAKFGEISKSEAKRHEKLSTRYRLGELTDAEYERERSRKSSVRTDFLAWARSGDAESDARKRAEATAKAAFEALKAPNRIYAIGMVAAGDAPTFSVAGAAGKRWRKILGFFNQENWRELVQFLAGAGRPTDLNDDDIRLARQKLDSLLLPVKIEFRSGDDEDDDDEGESGPWVVELLPSNLASILSNPGNGKGMGVLSRLRFAGEAARLERNPEGDGYIAEFPVVRTELAVFFGDKDALDEKIDGLNEQWRSGLEAIRRRIELTLIDEKDAVKEATTLSNRLKRDFACWQPEN